MKEFLKKVLWATDFSEESKTALAYAEQVARSFGSHLTALHVVPDFAPVLYESHPDAQAELTGKIDLAKVEAQKKLEKMSDAQKVKFDKILIRQGSPAPVVVEAATEEKADLVVIGRKGYSDHDKTLIGGVAHQILRSSPIPVLITKKTDGHPKIKKILVPTDFSEHEDVERSYAWKLAKGFGASLGFLYVLELFGHDFRLADDLFDSVLKKFKARIKREHEDIEITDDVTRAARAYEGIVDYSESKGYDLIVMSTQVRKVARFFLGSTTEKVVTLSCLPVFAIPPDRD
jgi:nucleotide-binding universal stress UspA family protein